MKFGLISEFAAFKACLLFNQDACDLSLDVKEDISRERSKYLSALFYLFTNRYGLQAGAQKYGTLLMMTASIQVGYSELVLRYFKLIESCKHCRREHANNGRFRV